MSIHEGIAKGMSTPNNPDRFDDNSQQSGDDTGQYSQYGQYGQSDGYDFSVGGQETGQNQAGDAYYAGGYGAEQSGGFEALNESKNPVAPWALGIGILSLIGSIVLLGSLLGIIGIVLSIVSLVVGRKRRTENRRTVMSVVGLVTSILSIVVGIAIMIFGFRLLDDMGFIDCYEQHGDNEAALEQCVDDAMQEQNIEG
ncbi:DUF4190 domain-containing protein [Corynebacterium propinquum]